MMVTPHNDVTKAIIGAAIEVHKALGPGLLESAYQKCLHYEMNLRGIPVQCEVNLPVQYKGVTIDCGYRLDMLVNDLVVVELKAVEAFHPIHEAQLITYLRLGGWKLGLLINFNVPILIDGIRRIANNLPDEQALKRKPYVRRTGVFGGE